MLLSRTSHVPRDGKAASPLPYSHTASKQFLKTAPVSHCTEEMGSWKFGSITGSEWVRQAGSLSVGERCLCPHHKDLCRVGGGEKREQLTLEYSSCQEINLGICEGSKNGHVAGSVPDDRDGANITTK